MRSKSLAGRPAVEGVEQRGQVRIHAALRAVLPAQIRRHHAAEERLLILRKSDSLRRAAARAQGAHQPARLRSLAAPVRSLDRDQPACASYPIHEALLALAACPADFMGCSIPSRDELSRLNSSASPGDDSRATGTAVMRIVASCLRGGPSKKTTSRRFRIQIQRRLFQRPRRGRKYP